METCRHSMGRTTKFRWPMIECTYSPAWASTTSSSSSTLFLGRCLFVTRTPRLTDVWMDLHGGASTGTGAFAGCLPGVCTRGVPVQLRRLLASSLTSSAVSKTNESPGIPPPKQSISVTLVIYLSVSRCCPICLFVSGCM